MIITIYGYDEYLLTDRNLDTFVAALKAEIGYIHGIIEEGQDGGLRIEILNAQVTKDGIEYIENFWEADPRRTVIGDSDTADALYEIIDDIDTISDIAGTSDGLYRRLVENRIEARYDFCESDGYRVLFHSTRAVI